MADSPAPAAPDKLPRRLQIQALNPDDPRSVEAQTARRRGVIIRRQYFHGEQYVDENVVIAEKFAETQPDFEPRWQRLPEHQRLHAYSEDIPDGLNFIADQLTGNMQISADNAVVSQKCEDIWVISGLQFRMQDISRETMIAGDLFVRVVPFAHDPDDDPQAMLHLWEAEVVEAYYSESNFRLLDELRIEEHRFVNEDGKNVQKRFVSIFRMEIWDYGGDFEEIGESLGLDRFQLTCVERIEIDGDEVSARSLDLPFIPWVHMHGEQKSLRSMYGDPLLSFQLMETIDRMNANDQLEFLAVRYNSYGNVVITGDEAFLRDQTQASYTISMDVADALVFPGGTDVHAVTLSINVEAYEYQRSVLVEEAYGLMGLERIDSANIAGLGGVSGYALEILNRKTDGTFRRIVENQREGMIDSLNMMLWVDQIVREAEVDVFGIRHFWDVELNDIDRTIKVDFGTAYIVDEVAVRDDFLSGMISRREALRKNGYDDDEIEQIELDLATQAAASATIEAEAIATALTASRFSTERA